MQVQLVFGSNFRAALGDRRLDSDGQVWKKLAILEVSEVPLRPNPVAVLVPSTAYATQN